LVYSISDNEVHAMSFITDSAACTQLTAVNKTTVTITS